MFPRLFTCLAALCIGLLSTAVQAGPPQFEARVIVKFREDSTELKRAQAYERAQSLSSRLGLALKSVHEPAPGIQVLRTSGMNSEELARRMSVLQDVDYAVPDRMKRVKAIPNDPLYPGQWYLQAVQPAALNAVSAWDKLIGATGPVVAVIDTGIRPDHPDLAAKILPGYDFISEIPNAGDGDGRDSDPSDPGDYIDAQDLSNNALMDLCGAGTQISDSSWHGTRVSGIVAASSNNAEGIAGLSRNGRILPLRVMGKCGGYDSDIIAAMRWAAGLSVPGVPANANPARIINLSLAGPGTCSTAYKQAISEINAKGVVIVAAAGNETSPVEEPANCPGVLAVAGLRHVGTKVGYSSLGKEVGISAPAGNCVNTDPGQECLYPINTTTNLGLTVPAVNGYTDGYNFSVGTSFSAPLVAGAAALMLEVHPGLSVKEIMRRLKAAANPFPVDPTLPTCPNVGAVGSGIDGQCNCTTSTCGAGMLDADRSLSQALAPAAVIVALDPLVQQANIRLDSSSSTTALGRSITSWNWTLVQGPAGATLSSSTSEVANLQSTTGGDYRIRLEVRDDTGASNTTESVLTIPGGGGDGGGGGGSLDLAALLGLLGLGMLAYLSRRMPRA
jgi:serine protease